MPYLIQYFVNGLGRDAASCSDLMSYLLFTPKYTRALIDIGYNDADRRIDEIEDFLFASPADGNRPGSNGTAKAKPAAVLTKRSSSSVRSNN